MTRDTPAAGLVIWQPARAFRYGAEAFWLAGFALDGGMPRTAIDLGTGSGIAAGLLAARGIAALGVDVRPEWRPLWDRTLAESAVAGAFDLRVVDVSNISGTYDLAIANPPYFPAGSGPASPDPWKAAARTEAGATIGDFVRAATRVAQRACFVVPVEREADVVAASSWSASRIVRVGRKRSLIELRPSGACVHTAITEVEAAIWYPAPTG